MPLWSTGESLLSSRVVLEVHVGAGPLVARQGADMVVLVLCAAPNALAASVVCCGLGAFRGQRT